MEINRINGIKDCTVSGWLVDAGKRIKLRESRDFGMAVYLNI